MGYCEKCKVTVTGRPSCCPLCRGTLTGELGRADEAFPAIPFDDQPRRRLIRLAALGTVVAAAVSFAINLSLPGRWWSLFVVAGLASGWLTLGVSIKKRKNIPSAIMWQVWVVSLLAVVWDLCTGFLGWSVDYVLPILCTCTMVGLSVIAQLKHLEVQDYILYLILDIAFGLVPLVLFLCDVLRVVYPSAICIAASVIFLAALLLFEGTALKNELIRRFHL